jgi:N-methylhydantoinase B/oxoprolinase/acetone carboxylase alpha subunit
MDATTHRQDAVQCAGDRMPVAYDRAPTFSGMIAEKDVAVPMRDGDIVILNDPYAGGTHLPDVTLVMPVFFRRRRVGYVANRAHHADIGGISPGSMSPNATTIEEEGVYIDNFKLAQLTGIIAQILRHPALELRVEMLVIH